MVKDAQGGTCAQNLQQLVNHSVKQLFPSSTSAPEAPAINHSNDLLLCSTSQPGRNLAETGRLRNVWQTCKRGQALHSCAQGSSPRHALQLDGLALLQLTYHSLEHLQASSLSTEGNLTGHLPATSLDTCRQLPYFCSTARQSTDCNLRGWQHEQSGHAPVRAK